VGFWVAVFPSWQIKKLATGFCRFCPKAKATEIRVVPEGFEAVLA